MTKAFCHVVVHYSIARLSWKTIKSLRRSRLQRKKYNRSNATPATHQKNDDDDVVPEYEILQGWTILAFHSLYVSLGIEYFVRFIIPFYFHVKMIVLIATFVVPSWAGKNGGGDGSDFGLSPVIPYWFDYLIVPGVHRVHELLDQDPKGWAVRQLRMLPFWIIDVFVLPGVLSTDEEQRTSRVHTPTGPPSEAFPAPISHANDLSSDLCFGHLMLEQRILRETKIDAIKSDSSETTQTPPRDQNTSLTASTVFKKLTHLSPAVQSQFASSAMKLKRFSREHRNNGDLLSPNVTPRRYKPASEADKCDKSHATKPPLSEEWSDKEDWGRSSSPKPRRRRRERLSAGDHFRELVTGDPHVRVRDHLFDLDLPSSPRRGLGSQTDGYFDKDSDRPGSSGNRSVKGYSNVTARRRSTRLAKKKIVSS